MKDFKEQLADKMAIARNERQARNETAKLSLLDNPNFIDAKLNSIMKSEELVKLNVLVEQVNSIDPFIAKDGTKYRVRVFPVQVFGLGFGQLIGLIKGSDNAFTDEMLAEYSAVTGVEAVELREASQYLGSVSYCTKAGNIVNEVSCEWDKFQPLLFSIGMTLGLDAFDVGSITKDKVDLWFAKENIKAIRTCKDLVEAEQLDANSTQFTLED